MKAVSLVELKLQALSESERSGETVVEVCRHAWETICDYPTATRRRSAAANLMPPVLHDTTRALRKENDPRAVQTPVATTDAQVLARRLVSNGLAWGRAGLGSRLGGWLGVRDVVAG